MANVLHSTISDGDRHEAKGASSAGVGTVLFANGDGSTTFRKLNYADMGTKPVSHGYEQSLVGVSTATTQIPSAVDTVLQVEFGAPQTLTDVSINSTGTLTFHTAGDYLVKTILTTSSEGAITSLFIKYSVNGGQFGETRFIQPTASGFIPFTELIPLSVASGDTLQVEIYADSSVSGSSNGGLYLRNPSPAGWVAAPSASIHVYRLQALS